MATQQEITQARQNSTLQQRFYSELVSVSDAIKEEPTSTDHHYLRLLIVNQILFNQSNGNKIASAFQDRAISQDGILTLPLADDGGNPPQQTAPTDLEITTTVAAYLATPSFLAEIVDLLLR